MAKAEKTAKTKKSKATKAAKTEKAPKLPKTVAGIELPKELREQGAKLLELTKHPLVADIVAAGLVALAGNVRKKAADAQAAAAPAPAADAPKASGMDDFAKTASSLATLIAARAAEKITAKLSGEKPPEAPVAEAAPAAPKKAAAPKKPAVAKKPTAKAAPAKKPAAAKPAATKAATATKAPAKPRAPRAAKPKTPGG